MQLFSVFAQGAKVRGMGPGDEDREHMPAEERERGPGAGVNKSAREILKLGNCLDVT